MPRRIWTLTGLLMLGLVVNGTNAHGVIPMPLIAELDIAWKVYTGKIIDVYEVGREYEGKLIRGRAKMDVTEVLKGKPEAAEEINVVLGIDQNLHDRMESPPKVYKKGLDGLWIIMPDGQPSHGYGRLGKDRKEEVMALLKELDGRIWSEEVAGIRVWAARVRHDWLPREDCHVVFAARNVSKERLWLPRSCYREVVKAIARDSGGKEYELTAIRKRVSLKDPVECIPLDSGQTRYMHPDFEDHGFFKVPEGIPEGRYTIDVTLSNESDGEEMGGSGKKVSTWKGKVSSPPFSMTVVPSLDARIRER